MNKNTNTEKIDSDKGNLAEKNRFALKVTDGEVLQ